MTDPKTQPAVCGARGGGDFPVSEEGAGGRIRGPLEGGRGTEIVGWAVPTLLPANQRKEDSQCSSFE